MHHIASDGWSMGILWQQLASLYEALLSGKPSPLANYPFSMPILLLGSTNGYLVKSSLAK
jgi:hypothetical protein